MYIKQNFVDGQVLSAAHLDALEEGILEAQDLSAITPAIGENGHWFVGDSDTGVTARGDRGEPGAPGPTPVAGTDYFTEADKQSIVDTVLASLPDGDEVSY